MKTTLRARFASRRISRCVSKWPLVGAMAALMCVSVASIAQSMQPAPNAPSASSDVATLRIRSLAAQCAQCHGSDGRALAGSEVPGLAGMPQAYVVEQMKAFRAGTRPSTVMQQLAKGFSDTQVEQLARYFAAQGGAPKP